MLKKLRVKFVCINMALLMAMLCVILGLVVHFTRLGLESESIQMMRAAAARPLEPGRPNWIQEDLRLPCFTIRLDWEGHLFAVGSGYDGLSEEDLITLREKALAAGTPSGVLEGYGLRFLLVGGPDQRLVFADVSREQATLARLTKTCILAGCVGFGALLLISFFLARWAVRPVERAWEQQKQFVADASHELKTPLTVITTNAELLEGTDLPPEARRQSAGNILTMSRQMRGLVVSLLELARVDSGAEEPAFSEVELSALVAEALLPFEAVLFERGLVLTDQIEGGIGTKGSASRLKQVVDILLDNARKYSAPSGEVSVSLRRKGRDRCLLSVSSPGEALGREDLENIFKRFYRMDKARTMDHSYGLGLSIAQTIVQGHRGKIWAESAPGVNTFFVELPQSSPPRP